MAATLAFRPEFRGASAQDPNVILAYGRQLENHTIDDLIAAIGATWWQDDEPGKMRGKMGTLVEAFFGLRGEAKAHDPDFLAARTELKTLPVLRGSRVDYRVKEPTSISEIDYCSLLTESWATAIVRRKLDRILFVVILVNKANLRSSTIMAVRLWEPNAEDLVAFQHDWEVCQVAVRDMIAKGEVVDPSQRIGLALAPRRKATDTEEYRLKKCGEGKAVAKHRAFALKPAFTRHLVLEWLRSYRFISVLQALKAEGKKPTVEAFEASVIEKMRAHVDQSLGSIAKELGIAESQAKNFAARIVRRFLGATKTGDRIREFEEFGILVKTLNLEIDTNKAFEGVSFPTFSLADMAPDDEFEDSELAQALTRVLFVPTYSSKKSTPQLRRRLGASFFWTPTKDQWEGIRREWEMFRDQILMGKAAYTKPPGRKRRTDALTKESDSDFIHVRPHAADKDDVEPDPLGVETTKRCFWLNRDFVQELASNRHDQPA